MDKEINILVVEDNPGDVYLIRRYFADRTIDGRTAALNFASDGEEALDYLFKSINEEERTVPVPALIILDLNLPKVNGKEILYRIKQHDQLRQIPVVIFSSSHAESDIAGSYSMHANCYVVKPYELADFSTAMHNIISFWLMTASLPALK